MAVTAAEKMSERMAATMKKLVSTFAAGAALAGSFAVLPAPVFAQAGQRTLTVFGNDPCPADAICVRAPESQRYRLPQSQNPQGTRQQRQSWAKKSQQLMSVGNTGAMQCSPVGPGGYTGCLTQEINQARQDAREQQQQNTPPQ
jgi:hypothetical protein